MESISISNETLADVQVGDVLVQRSIHERSLSIIGTNPWGLADRLQNSMREELGKYGVGAYVAGQKVTDLADDRVEIEVRLEIASLPEGTEKTVTLAGVPLWGIFVLIAGAASVLLYNLSGAIKSTRELIRKGGGELVGETIEFGKLLVAGIIAWLFLGALSKAA